MKRLLLPTILILISCIASGLAQDGTQWQRPSKKYQIWITLKDDMGFYGGHLYGIKEGYIAYEEKNMVSSPTITFYYPEIEVITYRRKGKVLKSAGLGLFIGSALGAVIGTMQTDDGSDTLHFDDSFYIATGAILGGGAGLITGLVVGQKKKVVRIGGDQDAFYRFEGELLNNELE